MKNIYLLTSLIVFLFFAVTSDVRGSLNVTATQTNNCNFGGHQGTATLTVHNGVRPFTYKWSPNVSTDSSATGLAAGTYTVTVKDSGSVDSATVTVSITQYTGNSLTVMNSTIGYAYCMSNKGSIKLNFFGGAYPYSYSWSNGGTTQSISGLSPGIYSVVITDAFGCTAGKSDSISGRSHIISLTKSVTNTYCAAGASGSANIGVTGVSGPSITSSCSFDWSNGATTSAVAGLTPGSYSVTVSDSFGCSASDSVTIFYTPFPASPICMVGVDSATGKNMVIWNKSDTLPVDSFIIYRETNIAGIYAQIGAQEYHVFSIFIDTGSNPAQQANRYKLACRDSCGGLSLLSIPHKTVHLTINQGIGNTWNLIWDAYEGFSFGSFNLYRGTTLATMSLLTTIASNLYSYTDLSPPLGTVYYMIEVVNPGSCNPTARTTSYYNSSLSNIVSSSAVGIKPIIDESSVSVFPNPVNQNVEIRFIVNSGNDISLAMNDITGRTVYSVLYKGVSGLIEQKIDCTKFAKGIYTIQFRTDGNQLNRKLVID